MNNDVTIVSTSQDRSNMSAFMRALKETGSYAPNLTRTALRFEIPLVAGQQFYELDIQKSTGNGDRKLEKKLQLDHKMNVTHVGIALQKQVPGSEANSPLFTHPDTNFFVVAGEAAALEAVYQGYVQFKTLNSNRTAEISTFFNRFVPARSYQTAAAAAQAFEHASQGPSLEERGFFELFNNLILDGKDTNKFTLQLGAGNLAAIQANTVVVVQLFGFLYIGEEMTAGLTCS
jgi:hypothetical protein